MLDAQEVAHLAVGKHGALQKKAELAYLLALLTDFDLRPKVIVEIGCDAGGTLWAWRQLEPRRLIGVSLPSAGFHSNRELETHGAELIVGDSHERSTFDELVKVLDGDEIDFLFIDADHTYEGAKQDLETYTPLVRAGGVIGLHDVCVHPNHPTVNVAQLWGEVSMQPNSEEIVTDPNTWGGIGVLYMTEKGFNA